jgi:hypothetical protein
VIDPNFIAHYNELLKIPLHERPVARRFWAEIVENLRKPMEDAK